MIQLMLMLILTMMLVIFLLIRLGPDHIIVNLWYLLILLNYKKKMKSCIILIEKGMFCPLGVDVNAILLRGGSKSSKN